jgi:hypothetical protein
VSGHGTSTGPVAYTFRKSNQATAKITGYTRKKKKKTRHFTVIALMLEEEVDSIYRNELAISESRWSHLSHKTM